MSRNLVTAIIVFLIAFVITPTFFFLVSSQSISLDEQQVIYNLPYPGLLPDHPLYAFKQLRDNIVEFTTRNPMKKAQLYLHTSDKYMAMALGLVDKGKNELAITTLAKAEAYFLKIPAFIKTSKQQGVSAPEGFMEKLYQSNAKHQEVIQQVMKEAPETEIEAIKQVLESNRKAYKALQNIK